MMISLLFRNLNKGLLWDLFKIPVLLLIFFYVYFGFVLYSVYSFHYIGIGSLFLLPRLFLSSFLWMFFLSLLFVFSQWWRILFRTLAFMFFLISMIYIVQYFSLYYSRNFLIREALAEFNAFGIFITFKNLVKVFGLLTLFCGIFLLLLNGFNEQFHKSLVFLVTKLVIVIVLFFISFFSYYSYQLLSRNYASAFPSPKQLPEVAFLNLFVPQATAVRPYISLSESNYLKENYGICLYSGDYPYLKNFVFNESCPYRIELKSKKQANVIVFFVESLSARFLTPYSTEFKDITLNIDSFAQSSMRIDDYYNHTIPTLNGLVGQLCSVYPCFTNDSFEDKQQNFNVRSLIHVLNDNGYQSTSYCYENKGFTLYNTMQLMGFKKRWFKQDIENKMNLKSSRNDYLYDKDLFKFYINQLNTHQFKEPFFHTISTIDTHTGFELSKNYVEYPYCKNNFLSAVYNFDVQFGLFWKWFLKSDLKDNTIVILTADHCLPYSSENALLYHKNNQDNSLFDKVPLIIYSPNHSFPSDTSIHSSSISLAPTILHLLGINDKKNSFVGKSIFDECVEKSLLGIYSDLIFRKTKTSTHEQINNDTAIAKWMLLNRYVFESDKLYPKGN